MRKPPVDRSPSNRREFGVVLLDKPPGPSAHEVSAWVRDLVGVDRAGHIGTLDPKVTGVLPLLLGDATRIAAVFDAAPKEYIAVLELHGEPQRSLSAVLNEFEGPIYQQPPKKSAVARRLRTREIYACELLERTGRQVLLRIRCASGTYIRKLCHHIGLAVGTGAHMGDLRRTAVGPFDDRELWTLHELADALAYDADDSTDPPIALADVLKPAEWALQTLPHVTIAESAATAVATGAPVYAPGVIDVDPTVGDPADQPQVVCVTPGGTAVCLGHLVGDPTADTGRVVSLDRVLVDPE